MVLVDWRLTVWHSHLLFEHSIVSQVLTPAVFVWFTAAERMWSFRWGWLITSPFFNRLFGAVADTSKWMWEQPDGQDDGGFTTAFSLTRDDDDKATGTEMPRAGYMLHDYVAEQRLMSVEALGWAAPGTRGDYCRLKWLVMMVLCIK